MSTMIEIYTSRKKNIFILLLDIVFIMVGVYFFLYSEEIATEKRSPLLIQGVGIVTVIFALFALFFVLKNLINKRWVLRIDEKGLTIRNQGEYFIPWSEIVGFQELNIRGSRSVLIFIKNPKVIIEEQKNRFIKKMMQWSLSMSGTPVNISSSVMQIRHKELLALLQEYWNKYKK